MVLIVFSCIAILIAKLEFQFSIHMLQTSIMRIVTCTTIFCAMLYAFNCLEHFVRICIMLRLYSICSCHVIHSTNLVLIIYWLWVKSFLLSSSNCYIYILVLHYIPNNQVPGSKSLFSTLNETLREDLREPHSVRGHSTYFASLPLVQ